MRVLMISKTFCLSTAQRKLEELAKCPGVDLTLVTPPYWQDGGSKQVLEKLYTTGYRMLITPIVLKGHFHTYFYPQLARIMREVRPDLLHIDEEPYNLAAFHAMRLAQHHHIPALFVAWQNIYRDYPAPFHQMESYNYRHARLALAGNLDVAEVLKRKGFHDPIHVVPLSIDPEIYQRNEPRRPRAIGDPFILGYVGRLTEEKGPHLLIEALPGLPAYCRAVFVGNGPMRSTLEELATRLGIAERVTFKNGVPTQDVPREMQQMDAFVLPSLTRPNWMEQFGRVLIESMACETPVIGSSSGEIPRVIGDAGLIFQEGNVQDLSVRVRELLENPALYARLATQGRQRILEHYTNEQVAKKMYTAYQEIVGSKILQGFGVAPPRQ